MIDPRLAALAASGAIGLAVGAIAVGAANRESPPSPASSAPLEDEQGFNCIVHGNGECGTPYLTCINAAALPVNGFAEEVCDVLAEGAAYVPTGPITYRTDGGWISLPSLAESVADSCPDAPDVKDCVDALVRERQEAVL